MHDFKNIFLAWISSATSIFAALDTNALIAILSAVVLPIVFFTIGKSIDVALQIYFKRREERRQQKLL